jgi:Arc/MetJ-type ribon-helix-helix transcriptional regulator
MKARISATIEDKNKKYLDSLLKDGKYRNKSHVIDTAIELLKEKEEKNGK